MPQKQTNGQVTLTALCDLLVTSGGAGSVEEK